MRYSKYSNHLYTNFVHVFCLVYKERLNLSYRRFEHVAKETQLNRLLGFQRVPHFTTIQKFMKKINKQLLRRMVRACHKLLKKFRLDCCIDSTGFSLTNPSHYYLKRIDSVKVKGFVKTSMNIEVKHKLILDVETHSNRQHDNKDFIPLLQQTNHVSMVLADKAYDSQSNREYCWERNIEVHIPVREWKQNRKNYGLTPHYNKHHRIAVKRFNPEKYCKRSLIESVNSAVKRTLGSWINSKNPLNQEKQAMLKALTYNIERIATQKINLLKNWLSQILTGFLQSRRKRKALITQNPYFKHDKACSCQ